MFIENPVTIAYDELVLLYIYRLFIYKGFRLTIISTGTS